MLTVPPVMQKSSYDCGAACAAAVCQFWGVKCSLQDATCGLATTAIDGTDPRTLEAWLRCQGLYALAGEMDADDLKYHVRRGRPIILVLKDHYVVCSWASGQKVWMHDPGAGRQTIGVADLLGMWQDKDRLGASYDQFGIVAWRYRA